MIKRFISGAGFVCGVMFLGLHFVTFQGCTKTHPHEPVPADTVHVHHDHEIVVTDTVLQDVICEIVDLSIGFVVIGDQSAPNVYAYFVNGIEWGQLRVEWTFENPANVWFEVEFLGLQFGDVITIKVVEGSRAAVVGLSILDIKCSGG